MNGFPDCDDMGLAKEHKLQQEIDRDSGARTFALEHLTKTTGEKLYRFSDRPDEVYSTVEELYAKRGLPTSGERVFYDHTFGLYTHVNDIPIKIKLP
jgi:hypothetical protein